MRTPELEVIPHRYPCRLAGTAVQHTDAEGGTRMVDIDCEQTQAAGGCPWARDRPADIAPPGSPRYPAVRVPDCWYYGRSGSITLAYLNDLGYRLPPELAHGFHGPAGVPADLSGTAVPGMPPNYCHKLADWMADHGEVYLADCERAFAEPGTARRLPLDRLVAHAAGSYRYAVWWLDWAADSAEGADAYW